MFLRSDDETEVRAGVGRERTRWSIAGRLTLLYTLSALAMMLAVTSFQYWILVRSIEQHETLRLVDDVRILGGIVGSTGNDAQIIEHQVRDEGRVYHPQQQYIRFSRVLDEQGRVLAETPEMTRLLPATSFPPAVPWSEVSRSVASQPFHAPDGRVFYLASVWAPPDDQHGSRRVIQVAMENTDEQGITNIYRRSSFLVIFLSIALLAMGGGAIARRGMQPVRDMARLAEQITASRLNLQFDPTEWPAELTPLAEAFLGMLIRLEDSFERCHRCAEDLAHEIRTPIQNLMGEAQVALSRRRTADEYQQTLESSLEEYDRLSRMINELLFLARADNPTTAMAWERVDVRRELETVGDYHDAEAQEHGVTLAFEGQAWVSADASLFRRVLNNLLANALRHTPRGGQVTLAVRTLTDGQVEVTVSDTGSGIAPEHLAKLGTRLSGPDRAAWHRGGGAGIGLAIVKSIMTLHGGSVTVESSEGHGTKVILRFPPAPPANVSAIG